MPPWRPGTLAGRPTRTPKGRQTAPLRNRTVGRLRLSGADRLARGGLGRGGRRVLELLLSAEQRVEDLLAQTLAEGESQARANEPNEEHAAATPTLPLSAQRVGCLAQRRGRLAELLLDLLVLGQGPDRSLAVRHPRIRLARGLEGRAKVVAQVIVLDQPLYVLVRTNRLTSGHRSGSGLGGSFLGCHRSPRDWLARADRRCPRGAHSNRNVGIS